MPPVELAKVRCPSCGGYMLEHPKEEIRHLWLKCSCCGLTRPTLRNEAHLKKLKEKSKK